MKLYYYGLAVQEAAQAFRQSIHVMKKFCTSLLIAVAAVCALPSELARVATHPSMFANAAFAQDAAPVFPTAPGGSAASPAQGTLGTAGTAASAPAAPALEDYTSKLRMFPGMTILYPVSNSCDRMGRSMPDYSMVVQIEKPSNDCAYSFKWTMTGGLTASGVRAVDQASKRGSRKVSLFYKNGEECTLSGYTSAVRVSDAMYRDLKSGSSSRLELDGPFAQSVRHAPAIPLPQNIAKVGEEDVPMQVDEKKVTVHTLKVVGDNPPATGGPFKNGGWTYWILDNPDFPMIVKGQGPFTWDSPLVHTSDGLGSDPNGTREGKRIVNDLKKKGIATTNAILFDFDSDKLKPSAKPILNEVYTFLSSNKSAVQVQGHCDIVGGFDYNIDLSRRRAKSVCQYLIDRGIDTSRLKPEGYGWTKPVASNKTAAGRAKNRRVVFKIIGN
jgi:outer membrane protein OmpA-like peptidoglycan-associated protein